MTTTIAIIDDDERFRTLARLLLRARGLEVVGCAGDMASGITAVERLLPDAVLIDYHLPDGDGLTLARLLGGMDPAPAIVLTSAGLDEVPADVLAGTPVRAFVPKAALASVDLPGLIAGPRGPG